MADPKDPNASTNPPEFQNFPLEVPDASDPRINSASRSNGLTFWQRFAAKNIYDTQPKKRAAYLKKLGYELGKDGESYRPDDSDGSFHPIEPVNVRGEGLLSLVPDYSAEKGGAAEFGKDVLDSLVDTFVTAPATTVGAHLGGSAGLAKGSALGGGPLSPVGKVTGAAGMLTGAAAGSASANAMVEALKAGVGDYMLEFKGPQTDLPEMAYQSLIAGALGAAGKVGSEAFKAWKKLDLKKATETVKRTLVEKSNGKLSPKLMEDFIQNPESYLPENVVEAGKRLTEFKEYVFGKTAGNAKSTRDYMGGVAGKVIKPLNKAADLEIEKMSLMPEANFSVEEIVDILNKRTETLRAMKHKPGADAEKVLAYLDTEIERIKGVHEKFDWLGQKVGYSELNYKEGRDLLKRFQNAAYDKSSPVYENPWMIRVSHGMKEAADDKAGALGSQLPGINLKRSAIIKVANRLNDKLTNTALQEAYKADNKIAMNEVKTLIGEADNLLGTRMGETLESTQFKAQMNDMYTNPKAFGSGAKLGEAMVEGLRAGVREGIVMGAGGGVIGAVAGAPLQAAIPTAIAAGARKAHQVVKKELKENMSPDDLIRQASKIKNRVGDIDRDPTFRQKYLSPFLNPAGQVAAREPNIPMLRPEPAAPAAAAPQQQPSGGLPPEFQDFPLEVPDPKKPQP